MEIFATLPNISATFPMFIFDAEVISLISVVIYSNTLGAEENRAISNGWMVKMHSTTSRVVQKSDNRKLCNRTNRKNLNHPPLNTFNLVDDIYSMQFILVLEKFIVGLG